MGEIKREKRRMRGNGLDLGRFRSSYQAHAIRRTSHVFRVPLSDPAPNAQNHQSPLFTIGVLFISLSVSTLSSVLCILEFCVPSRMFALLYPGQLSLCSLRTMFLAFLCPICAHNSFFFTVPIQHFKPIRRLRLLFRHAMNQHTRLATLLS